MGVEFQFYEVIRFLEMNGSDGSTTSRMYLTTLKMVKTIRFML